MFVCGRMADVDFYVVNVFVLCNLPLDDKNN